MNKEQLIEKLRAGYQLHNRGTSWWLSEPKRRGGGTDGVMVDADLMNRLEVEGTLRIVMLTTSMLAELPQ
jgi:hypothetical protein